MNMLTKVHVCKEDVMERPFGERGTCVVVQIYGRVRWKSPLSVYYTISTTFPSLCYQISWHTSLHQSSVCPGNHIGHKMPSLQLHGPAQG